MREERKGTRERGQGYLSQRNKGLPQDREETDLAVRQMAVYKEKLCQDEVFNFDFTW